MQEGGHIGWDPPLESTLPWGPRIFVFYLIVVLLIGIVKSWKLARYFWFSALSRSGQDQGARVAIRIADDRIASFRRLTVLTLLLSILVAVIWASQISEVVTTTKYFGPAPIFGSLAQELHLLSLGLGVSAFLYILAWIGVLNRRRNSMEH